MEAIAIGKGLYLKPYRKGLGLYLKPPLHHHGVLKESSTTTKLKVVFNGSHKAT